MNRPLRRYLTVALFLGAMLGATYGLMAWRVAQLRAQPRAAQAEAVARAVAQVEREVAALQAELLGRAEALAAAGPVRRALLEGPQAWPAAVRYFGDLRLPDGVTAELYTPRPELVAWQGPSMPFGPATRTTPFLSRLQVATAADGDVRRAVVLWLPVREGRRVLGAVRVLRLVEARVPVRNQYLEDEDVAEAWEDAVEVPMNVVFSAGPLRTPEGATVHPVAGIDGNVLVQVVTAPPAPARLVATVRKAFGDAASFWVVLLLGWGAAGLWWLHERVVERARDDRTVRGRVGAGVAFLGLGAAWWGARYALLGLHVPARWIQTGPLFDPVLLASGFGGGLLGSIGELVLTSGFAVVFGFAVLRFGLATLRGERAEERARGVRRRPGRGWPVGAFLAAAAAAGVLGMHATLLRRATVDATLPYFDRTGPLPEGMTLLVFGALLLLTLAAVAVLVGLAALVRVRGGARLVGGALAVVVVGAAAYGFTPLRDVLPWPAAAAYVGVAALAAWVLEREPGGWAWPLTLRGTLLTALVLAALTYPVLFDAADDEAEARLIDAVEDFADGEDVRVAFALEQVLLDARASEALREAFRADTTAAFDSLATDLVTGSLLAALADYTVGLALLAPDGDSLGAYRELPPPGADPDFFGTLAVAPNDPLSFQTLRRRYAAADALGFLVEREPARGGRGKYRYAGVGPVRAAAGRAGGRGAGALLGWVVARAEPKPARYVSETPFPRVLVPAGLYDVVDAERAFGEFRGGVLVRTRGGDFGRFRLPEAAEGLAVGEALWREETVGERRVRAYYRRVGADRVVGVRLTDVSFFDHLYFFLRLLLPGLLLAGVAYGAGRP
ncbi:MAG: hypothetical protein R3362_07340, partial [Rhodothermales bacterium]|nr:hypothetical protein [Rhodothermales bacterium]